MPNSSEPNKDSEPNKEPKRGRGRPAGTKKEKPPPKKRGPKPSQGLTDDKIKRISDRLVRRKKVYIDRIDRLRKRTGRKQVWYPY